MHVQRLIFCLTFQYFFISQGQSGYKWYSLPNMKKKYQSDRKDNMVQDRV